MSYIVQHQDRFYVVAYDRLDPLTGRERRRWHPVGHDRAEAEQLAAGKVTLRVNGRLHDIGIGRPLAGTPLIMLIHDLDIRIIHAATGEIIRTLTLNPDRQYQPTGAKRGGPQRPYGPRKTKQPEP